MTRLLKPYPLLLWVPAGSPSRGGDVVVYVGYKPAELAHSFLFRSCVYFCLCGPFNCIPFQKFSRQLSAFSLCSSGLISASLVLSTILFMKLSLSPDIILSGWLCLRHQLTNQLTQSTTMDYIRAGVNGPLAPSMKAYLIYVCRFSHTAHQT